jgi:small-conductance mechanosensitive channel
MKEQTMSLQVREIGLAVLIVVLAWLLSRLSKWIIGFVSTKVIGRTHTHLDDTVLDAADFPLRAAIVVGGIDLALEQVSLIPTRWDGSIGDALFVVYFLIVYVFLYRLIGGLIVWYGREVASKTETELDDRYLDLFRRVALLILSVVVIVTVLGRYGIEVSALVTTLGIGSLAVALAAQETLGDMITGFTIMVDQPFKVGDRVELLDINTWGDVVDIGLRSTRIRTRDNRMVSVPNSVIGKGLVVNYSDPDTVYRVETHVGVAYGTDIEQARSVMIEAIRAEDWVMKDERIEALFLEFGDSALIFRVRCWIKDYVETRRIMDKMNTALYQALNEAGIAIPFPQRDVHLISQHREG